MPLFVHYSEGVVLRDCVCFQNPIFGKMIFIEIERSGATHIWKHNARASHNFLPLFTIVVYELLLHDVPCRITTRIYLFWIKLANTLKLLLLSFAHVSQLLL